MIADFVTVWDLKGEQISPSIALEVFPTDVALREFRINCLLIIQWDITLCAVIRVQYHHVLISEEKELLTAVSIYMEAVSENFFELRY